MTTSSIEQPDGLAALRLAAMLVAFTDCADRGEPLAALDLCAPDFQMGPPDDPKDIAALRGFLEMRAAADYETRHLVGFPVVESAAPDRVSGRAVVVSHRRAGDTLTVATADFALSIVRVDDRWLLDRLRIVPFGMRAG